MANILNLNGEEKSVPIGGDLPTCPSCGTPCGRKWTRCEVCGAALTGDGGGQSRLSEAELLQKLQGLSRQKKIMTALTALCLVPAAISLLASAWTAMVLFALAAGVFFVLRYIANNKLSVLFKVNVVQDALSAVFGDCVYQPDGNLPRETISSAGLVDGWNKCYGEDYVSGTYKGHRIEYSDVHLVLETTERDGDGSTSKRRTTVFKGQWMTCKLDKPVASSVRVRENAERAGLTKKLFGERVNAKGNVETENAAFNEQFQILTDDPHTAFYILTPHFMEYIVAADKQANARIYLCFMGDTLHIAVGNDKDSFEVRSGEEKNLPRLRARLQEEISLITSILDELFQNENLF